ncbi:CAP-Gly domain-containing linker protein 1 isoform X2 [Alosa alosa]|uniref:CAP-Gly domain-containing linker protein 1 isoform X2 n=1 Tax=Alosa alosa TaxID=278164 RepID=UPI00201547E1|nr:CAP-Gly domain-containing linker protein 1 isoform X2 [Alosa alosa]
MMEWSMEAATTFEELADLEMRLLQDGLRPNAEPVERLLHLWRLCLRTEGSMNAARLEVKALQEAHDRENMEVQKKLDQVRVLIAKQNSFNVKLEEENQQLHAQLKQLHLDKEAEKMEVAELLDQGGLCEIILSSPSEQVAYLLVERASLLERLQALDVEKSPSLMAADPAAVFKDGMDKSSGVEPSEDCGAERLNLERDLDEASRRLSMAHKEIRRLTDELESAHMTQKAYETKLQEVEFLKQEVERLRLYDVSELQKARELNERLDNEMRILREQVRSVDNERMLLLALLDKKMMEGAEAEDEEHPLISLPKVEKVEISVQAVDDDMESVHERCLKDLKEKDVELRRLQTCTQQLQKELSQLQLQRDQAQQLLGEQEQNHRSTVEDLKKELEFLESMVKHAQVENQNPLIDDYKVLTKAESVLQQKDEQCAEMLEILHHNMALLNTAEADVLSGKEKITELEKLNAELDHKNQQVLAELQEALARVSELERNCESKSAELQKLLEKSRELQLHLDTEQNMHHQSQQESLLQQKAEECAEMRGTLENISGLLHTAETEVLSEKEKITELEKLNAELDHKNQQVFAELQEALARVYKLENNRESQSAELQKIQEKSRELQHHLDTKQNMHHQGQQELDELHMELKLEKDRVFAKEKELQELQKQLQQTTIDFEKLQKDAKGWSDALHNQQGEVDDFMEQRRLWLQREGELQQAVETLGKLEDTHNKSAEQLLELQGEVRNLALELELVRAENEQLKNEAKDMDVDLATLRAQAQEAEKQRQLWLYCKKKMEQQIKALQDKQASMTLSEKDFQCQVLDLKAKLAATQMNEQTTKLELQSYLGEHDQLLASQNEVLVLKEELKKLLDEKAKVLNKYNEKKEHFMDKFCAAKLFYTKEMLWRDDKIQELQRNCDFLTKQVGKVKETTMKMDEVNSKLLKENHEFQCELLKEKEDQNETLNILKKYKLRIEHLEKMNKMMENEQLWNHSQITRYPFPHAALGKSPSATNQSALPGGDTKRDLLDMIQNTQTTIQSEYQDVSPAQSLTHRHTYEIGYLNLTPPFSPPRRQMQAESSRVGSEEVPQADRRSCLTERFL